MPWNPFLPCRLTAKHQPNHLYELPSLIVRFGSKVRNYRNMGRVTHLASEAPLDNQYPIGV